MKISPKLGEFTKRTITSFFLVVIFGSIYLYSSLLFSLLLTIIAGIIIVHELPTLVDLHNIWMIALSLLYPVLPLASLILLNHVYHNSSPLIPLYPFFIAWTADTCGYVVGTCCGYHKMCPRVSPGKTWEGFIGSFLGVVGLHWIVIDKFFFYQQYKELMYPVIFIIALSLMFTTVAFLGGFLLSYLKRRKNLKDVGALLPGHGGLLDRFDGVLAVTLAVWILVLFHAQ